MAIVAETRRNTSRQATVAWLNGEGVEIHCIVIDLDWYMVRCEHERMESIPVRHIFNISHLRHIARILQREDLRDIV